jgi:hypothetical protein
MSTLPPKLENLRSKINERRKSIEQIRSFNVRRLQTDIKKITKQEIDFTKKLLEQMVPVKMVWNEEATKRLRDMVPFTVELNREEEDVEEEAGSDSLSTTKSADEL